MQLHHRQTRFVLLLALAGALALAGCSKKPAESDVTKNTPGPDSSSTSSTTVQETGGNPSDNPSGSQADDAGALKDVFFAYDDYSLSGEAKEALTSSAGYLREMSTLRVMVEGHCDERGTVEYNLALGQRRADAARGYLVNLGVDGGRLSTISYGEERPFAEGHDESAWSQNRRAHFRVINP
jgi:peptidoglycan-associated lipoprotein